MTPPAPISRRRFLGLSAGVATGAVLGANALAGASTLQRPRRRSPLRSGVTLNVPTAAAAWTPYYLEVVSAFEKATGNKVNTSQYPLAGLLTQETDNMVHKSNTYDVLFINGGWEGTFYSRGWVTPIPEIDSSWKWPKGLIEYGGAGRWDHVHKVTSTTGTPMSIPIVGNIQLLFFRHDIYAELGLKVPKTWNDVVANGRKAMKAGLAKYGYAIRGQADIGGYANTYDFGALLASYGGSWFADAQHGDFTPTINNEQGQAAMHEWLQLAKLGPAQPQTVGSTEIQSLMQSGQLAQAELVDASAAPMDDPSQSSVVDKVYYAPMPAGTGKGARPATMAGIWSIGVASGLPKERQKAAWEFITWMTSAASQARFTHAGGVPTSQAVYNSGLAKDTPFRFMQAVAKETPYITKEIDYTFAVPMLNITEKMISEIVAGSVSVKSGLDSIAHQIKAVAKA